MSSKRFLFALLSLLVGYTCFGQTNDEAKQVAVFVYCDKSVTTPVSALRARLTSTLVNEVDVSYIVVDRTDEILSVLRSEYDYQGSGMVRDDQLVNIGDHLGAYYLCVVSVTYYPEDQQYFFECKMVNVGTRRIEKLSFYPDNEYTMITSLSPQNQIKVAGVLSKMFWKDSASSSASGHASSSDYPYVDLGLSVKWAPCNLGASRPEEYGDYYAWGETSTKADYSWNTYKFRTIGDSYYNVKFFKYNTDSSRGRIDNKTVLEPEDDVAHLKLGGSWRIPTDAEWTELLECCNWTWTSTNGVYGYKVTGPNGNSIFLPAAGIRFDTDLYNAGSQGYYWSSSLYTDAPGNAWDVGFNSDYVFRDYSDRFDGRSVRPVSE